MTGWPEHRGQPVRPSAQTTRKTLQFFFPSFLLHHTDSPLHLCIGVCDCESLSHRTGEVSMQKWPHLYYQLRAAVVLCPQEFADPPSQICMDSSVRVCDTHETFGIPFLIELLAHKWANNRLLLLVVGSGCLCCARNSQTLHVHCIYLAISEWHMSKDTFFIAARELWIGVGASLMTSGFWLLWWFITCPPHRPHFLFEAKFWNVFEFLGQNSWTATVTSPAGLTDRIENLQQFSPSHGCALMHWPWALSILHLLKFEPLYLTANTYRGEWNAFIMIKSF